MLSFFLPVSYAIPILKIGTGDRNLYFYQIGTRLCRQIQSIQGAKCEVLPSNGSIENLFNLQKNKIDIALTQSDIYQLAQKGKGPFAATGAINNLKTISDLGELQLIILSRDPAIHYFSDIKNGRVNFGPTNSGLLGTLNYIAAKLNFFSKKNDILHISASAASHRCDLDVIALIVPPKSNIIKQSVSQCPRYFVQFSEKDLAILTKLNVGYNKTVIPANTYPLQTQPIHTISMRLIAVGVKQDDRASAKLNCRVD